LSNNKTQKSEAQFTARFASHRIPSCNVGNLKLPIGHRRPRGQYSDTNAPPSSERRNRDGLADERLASTAESLADIVRPVTYDSFSVSPEITGIFLIEVKTLHVCLRQRNCDKLKF
jgi:hypothetical protein